MTEAPRSEESTGKTRRRRTPDGAGVAEAGRPSGDAAPRVRAQGSTDRELDAELNQIAKDLQQIGAGVRASGVMSRQRKRGLREQLKTATAHIRRARVAARAEAAGAMRSSASAKPRQASGSPGGGRISAARADQLSKLKGEVRRLQQELNALVPAQVTTRGEQTKPSRRSLGRIAGAAALAVAAAVAGLLLGRSTGDNATTTQPAIAPASSQLADYEHAVGGQLQELAGARALALERLRHARSPAAQAAAGRDLAAAHRHAADAIAATATPASLKAVRRRVVDDLTHLAHGYRQLARGAADHNASRYTEGRRAVKRAEGDLGHGLDRIQEAPG
jgi:hypothetical protein